MSKVFAGKPIDGLLEACVEVIGERVRIVEAPYLVVCPSDEVRLSGPPMEFDDLVAGMAARGFTGPVVRDHLEWLCVNDHRIVRNGKRIRKYEGETA